MSLDTGLTDRIAVVTGAASGIGEAVTLALVAQGAHVVAGDVDAATLDALQERHGIDRHGITGVVTDLGSAEGCVHLVETAMEQHGRIDVLVNNVGIAPYRESFLGATDTDWRHVLEVNFFSMIRCCRAAIPHMVEQVDGRIVSIASDVGRAPDPFFVDYGVSKAAILSLSKALSIEFGPKGIRSNVVSPGPTRTPLWDRPGGFAESIAQEYGMEVEEAIHHFATAVRQLPLGRLGRPEDVANAVVFLASDLAHQVTGSEYCVNGGVLRVA